MYDYKNSACNIICVVLHVLRMALRRNLSEGYIIVTGLNNV